MLYAWAGVAHEEERNDSGTDVLCSGVGKAGAETHNDAHGEEHADGGDEPERSSSDTLTPDGGAGGEDQVPDLKTAVDQLGLDRLGDAERLEHGSEVVRDDTVSDPVGADSDGPCDGDTTSVGSVVEEIPVSLLGHLALFLDGSLDLLALQVDERVVFVSVGVSPGEDGAGLVETAFAHEPSGRLGDGGGQEEDAGGTENLKVAGDAPRFVAGQVQGTEAHPRGQDTRGVLARGEHAGDLGCQRGSDHAGAGSPWRGIEGGRAPGAEWVRRLWRTMCRSPRGHDRRSTYRNSWKRHLPLHLRW